MNKHYPKPPATLLLFSQALQGLACTNTTCGSLDEPALQPKATDQPPLPSPLLPQTTRKSPATKTQTARGTPPSQKRTAKT